MGDARDLTAAAYLTRIQKTSRRNVISCPLKSHGKDIAVKGSLFSVAALAVSALLCGQTGSAMSQTTPSGGATTSLPNVVVDAPKPQKPKHRAVAHSTVSPQTSASTPTSSASSLSPTEQLERLPNAVTSSCVDGCVTSFRSGNKPWVGCNGAGWPALSQTCRNVGHYKTYNECTTAGLAVGWRSGEISWYCSSLALK